MVFRRHPNLAIALAVLGGALVLIPLASWFWPKRLSGILAVGLVIMLLTIPVIRSVLGTGASTPARRFAAGLCMRCGYDLRSSPATCPECGRPVATAEAPLLAPSTPNTFSGSSPEVEEAMVILRRRLPTPGRIWPDEAHAAVAALVAERCRVVGEWPNDHFRPADSFALMIDDWEGAVPMDVAYHLRDGLGIDVEADELEALRDQTFGDVVARLVARASVGRPGVRS